MVEEVVATPDLGDTRAELVSFVDAAVTILGSTIMGRVMQGLVSDLASDPGLAKAFQDKVVTMRIAEADRLLARGIERGDLRADTDVELAHELLFGPVYYRLMRAARRWTRVWPGGLSTRSWPRSPRRFFIDRERLDHFRRLPSLRCAVSLSSRSCCSR